MKKIYATKKTMIAAMLLFCSSAIYAQNWFTLTTPFTDDIEDIYFLDAGKGYVVAGNNAYKTDDAGNNWTNMNVSLPATVILNTVFAASTPNGTSIYIIGNTDNTTGDNATIIKSTDDGNSWTALTIPASNAFMNNMYGFDANNLVIVGGESGNGGMILKTTDGGTTWVKTNMSTNVSQFNGIDFGRTLDGYAAGQRENTAVGGISYVTTDGGITWTTADTTNTNLLSVTTIPNTNGSYVSDEIGQVWLALNNATLGFTFNTQVNTPIYDLTFPTPGPGTGYAATDNGIMVSNTAATTWFMDPTFPGNESQYALHVDTTTKVVYIGGENGAMYRKGNPISIAENSIIEFEMYPNPAINQLTVKAETPINSIEVYDLLGRNVLTIETNLKEYKLDVSSLANGTYSIKVFTKEGSATQKLMKN